MAERLGLSPGQIFFLVRLTNGILVIFIMSIKNVSKSVRALESLYFIGCNLNLTVR